jgi:predicted phage terminase large subunit-like protein
MAIAVRGANRYIRPDLTRARLDLPGTIAAVRAMTGRYPKTFSKLIEGKANGPAVIQMLRGEVSGLLDIEPEGGKVARANGASPELRSGNWFLPHPLLAPWVGNPENPTESGFLAEAVVFPFGPNDDMVDAWTQAGIWIQKDGAGRVFLTSEQDIRVESVQIGQKWPRMFGMFVSPREVAAVWIFRRPETGEHFVAVEYTAPASDPVKHAAELVKLGAWIPGVVHTKGTGRDERDGKAMTQKYRDLGVKGLEGVQDNIAAEIIGLQEALSAGKLKVCSNLHRWFDQYRLVRRDEKGALPHYNVGVIMATLAAWRHKDKMRAPLEPAAPAQVQRGPLPNGWMGA